MTYIVKNGDYGSKAAYKSHAKRRKIFGAMHARNWKRLRKAERDGKVDEIIDAATYAVGFYDNGGRFPQTIRHAFWYGNNKTAKNPETFWPILIALWDGYDGTCCADMWFLDVLTGIMDGHKPCSGHEYIAEDSLPFFEDLPNPVTVYRGCARKHVKGIAWTTDIETARFFAYRAIMRDPHFAALA